MKGLHPSVLIALALLLSACSPLSSRQAAVATAVPPMQALPAGVDPFAPPAGDLVRLDQQGAVMVEVTPLNLGRAANQIEFSVAMNTHSVDLSMDLAALATLTTDTGISEQAASWDGPRGGHHVVGTLVFAGTAQGRSILYGASKLTLTIVDVDAAARTFEWAVR